MQLATLLLPRRRWATYLEDTACSTLLFVVDASSVIRSFEAKVDFYELVSDISSGKCGKGWTIVVALNKHDLPGTFDAEEFLCVSELRQECCGIGGGPPSTPISRVCSVDVSAVKGTGVVDLLEVLGHV